LREDYNAAHHKDHHYDALHCSLREAILASNADGLGSSILFQIPGTGPFSIFPQSPLPEISDELTIIDASTQNDWSLGSIVLEGSSIFAGPYGLVIAAPSCEIYGLQISGFREHALLVLASGHQYQIGGPNKGNLFNENEDYAIQVEGATNGQIRSNLFGTDPTGTESLGNAGGVSLREGADHTQIGGWATAEANLFAAMPDFHALSLGSSHNQVIGNTIGSDWTLALPMGNGVAIHISGAWANEIQQNKIAFNDQGILVLNGSQHLISQNQLFCNRQNAIDLADFSQANQSLSAPQIEALSPRYAKGKSSPSTDRIELFVQRQATCLLSPCQGSQFLGTAPSINGKWSLAATSFLNNYQLQDGDVLTAVAIDSMNNSSEFATCVSLCATFSALATNTGPYCYGDPIELQGLFSGVADELSFQWEGPQGYQSNEQSPTDATMAGTYTLTLMADDCVLEGVETVVIVESPPAGLEVHHEQPACEGSTLVLDAPLVDGINYQWYNPQGDLISTVDDATIPNITQEMEGVYQLIISQNNCAASPVFMEVLVQPTSEAPELWSNSPVCEGETLILTGPDLANATYR
ncbi:MAG: NosD domain-containing protein, partial [Bacteroidota bacterium]